MIFVVIIFTFFYVLAFTPTIVFILWINVNRTRWGPRFRVFKFLAYVVGFVNLCLLITLNSYFSNQPTKASIAQKQEVEEREKKYEEETAQVASILLEFLRSQGVNDSLVITVRPISRRRLGVVVTNYWLGLPDYEKKQLKQIIGMALKKIYPPDGYPFSILDYLGNRI